MAEGGTDISMSETKSVPGHSSLYGRHSQNYVENVSMEVCSMMTRLGYGEEFRRWRVEKYRELDWQMNASRSTSFKITAGSKGEGLTGLFESDKDFIFEVNGVLCVEDGINCHTIAGGIELYRMDTRVYPGHCRLFLERQARSRFQTINNALCDNGKGGVIFSSGLFIDELSRNSQRLPMYEDGIEQLERAGPSLPVTDNQRFDTDRVTALRCHCPGILQIWAARPRHWPSPNIVQKVVALGAYLYPVGFKGSEFNHMEWRICFNNGETELVNNLNDTQAKVYVLLKMILKNVLRPCKKEITSYVMKNIVLWQAENNPQNKFYARSLFHWLHHGLRELRTAILTQHLSYYMIPGRNLIAGSGLHDNQRNKWVTDITDMIAEGPRVILRLPKLRKAVIASPEPMSWLSKIRMELEMLTLEYGIRDRQCLNEKGVVDESDAILSYIMRRMIEIRMDVALRAIKEGGSVNDFMHFFLGVERE